MAKKIRPFDRERDHGLVSAIEGDINTSLTLMPDVLKIAVEDDELMLAAKLITLLGAIKGRFGVLQEALGISEITPAESLFQE